LSNSRGEVDVGAFIPSPFRLSILMVDFGIPNRAFFSVTLASKSIVVVED